MDRRRKNPHHFRIFRICTDSGILACNLCPRRIPHQHNPPCVKAVDFCLFPNPPEHLVRILHRSRKLVRRISAGVLSPLSRTASAIVLLTRNAADSNDIRFLSFLMTAVSVPRSSLPGRIMSLTILILNVCFVQNLHRSSVRFFTKGIKDGINMYV